MPGCKLRAPEKQLSCRSSNIFQKQFNFNVITLNTLPWTLQAMDLGLGKQSRNPVLIYRVFLFSFSFPRYFRETANAMFCFNFDQNHFVCRRNFVLVFSAFGKFSGFEDFALPNNPADIYLLIVNNRNTRTRCVICSKLTIKTPERRQASLLLTLNISHTLF